VVKHHENRRKAVRPLNLALPICQLLHGPGLALQVAATAMLLVYEVWLAHDHLDSPVLKDVRLPKVRVTAVERSAVTDPPVSTASADDEIR
jgi:hypothetical protein